MTPDEASKIINAVATAVRSCVDTPNAKGTLVAPTRGHETMHQATGAVVRGNGAVQGPVSNEVGEAGNFERLYQKLKARLIDECRADPVLLQLLTQQNELLVEFEPRVVQVDGNTVRGRVARQIAQGWFNEPKTTGGTRKELARTGADPGGGGTLSDVLASYVRDGFLERADDGYQRAPSIKVTEKELVAR